MEYKGDKTEEQLRQMQKDATKNLTKSKKNLKKKYGRKSHKLHDNGSSRGR